MSILSWMKALRRDLLNAVLGGSEKNRGCRLHSLQHLALVLRSLHSFLFIWKTDKAIIPNSFLRQGLLECRTWESYPVTAPPSCFLCLDQAA